MNSWIEYAVWWHVYPLGFTGALHEGPGHRLTRVVDWLDYAVELGASGLQLGPIFESETHGYDTTDHFRIDRRLGDDADFDKLVSAARERGLRLLLDGVFNHVGRGFRPERWFAPTVFEGNDNLVQLNHDDPEVLDYVVQVMEHWLDRGASGWRLDAAYAVPPAFWKAAVERVRPRHPDAWFVGEVIHGDYSGYLRESGLDSLTQYELWKAIWSSINDGNFFELAWALDRHGKLLGEGLPMTFVGNHDVTRIASQLTDQQDLPLALAILLTVGGTPSIYAGDEQGFLGVKEDREGGDDAVRPAFPDKPADLAPYGWPTYRVHQELIGLRRRHDWLQTARVRTVHLANEQFVYEASDGIHRLVVALNVGAASVQLPTPYANGLLTGSAELERGGEADATARLAPHSFAILDI